MEQQVRVAKRRIPTDVQKPHFSISSANLLLFVESADYVMLREGFNIVLLAAEKKVEKDLEGGMVPCSPLRIEQVNSR
ncbi:hypothetical protein GN956_G4162 [Arapaima gigas]